MVLLYSECKISNFSETSILFYQVTPFYSARTRYLHVPDKQISSTLKIEATDYSETPVSTSWSSLIHDKLIYWHRRQLEYFFGNWIWTNKIPPKRRYLYAILHVATSKCSLAVRSDISRCSYSWMYNWQGQLPSAEWTRVRRAIRHFVHMQSMVVTHRTRHWSVCFFEAPYLASLCRTVWHCGEFIQSPLSCVPYLNCGQRKR
jgi:hypothetical protein